MKYNISNVVKIDSESCASANYTMAANALGIDVSIHDIIKITNSEIGFAPFWKWLVFEKKVKIVNFSENNLKQWADKGFEEFSKKTDNKVVKFLKDRMKSPEKYQKNLQELFNNNKFEFHKQKPSTDLLKKYFADGYVCDVMCDPWLIYGETPEYYSLHRVFIVDIIKDEVFFLDPDPDPEDSNKRFLQSNIKNFAAALKIKGAELSCYKSY